MKPKPKKLDLFQTLKQDHTRVVQLIDELRQTSQKAKFIALRQELEVHASAEEEVIYPRIAEKDGEELTAEAQHEHNEIRDCLETLNSGGEEAWESGLEALEHAVIRHVDAEETLIFAKLRALFSESMLERIKREFLESKKSIEKELSISSSYAA